MQNLMIVKVTYTNKSLTMISGRFTYEDFDGTKHIDKVRLSKNNYKYDSYIEQAVDYLKEHGQNVIGTDDTAYSVSYIIIAPQGGFKSISGNYEKMLERDEL